MARGFSAALVVAAAMILLGGGAALAAEHGGWFHHRAPAPLLAAGVPAFAALGGGFGISQLVRRFKRGGPEG